jgi:hypothetical protein
MTHLKISASNWFYYKEICYDAARSCERKTALQPPDSITKEEELNRYSTKKYFLFQKLILLDEV